MSAPPYMKLYVGDYLGDTHHLSVVEHGAYLLLLMAMWRAGGSLPSADANLAKLARCTPDEWAAIRDVVMPFFQRRGGRITHKRIAAELTKYENTSGKRSEAGKQGASRKASKNNIPAAANASDPESNCRHNQNQNQNQSQILPFPEPPERTASQQRDAAASRGSRIKPDWQPSADNRAYAISQGFADQDVSRMADDFRDYWIAQPGQKGVKLDWTATWRRWVRNQAERRPKAQQARQVDWC